MTVYPEAKIALCKCGRRKEMFGIRMEKCGNDWNLTWAFPIKESAAKRENYDETTISGLLHCIDEYPGCPFCETKCMIICGFCKRLTCNSDGNKHFTCEWCGNQGEIGGEYDGSGIKSGNDY